MNQEIFYPEEYCVFDLETTGLDVDTARILEIGALKVKKDEKVFYASKERVGLLIGKYQ